MGYRQIGHLKKRFLASFATTGNITESCVAVGIKSRTSNYNWQEHDAAFAVEFRQAEIMATEVLETEARIRATSGTLRPVYQGGVLVGHVIEKSDTLLIFLLKARNPSKYREKAPAAPVGPVRYTLDEIRKGLGLDD
jgi:hypothetical protein